ncbi:MAG: fibro-slime domain-containing protein [Planctomycetota bacterium]|jgi:fibro-slime domain-containing protein
MNARALLGASLATTFGGLAYSQEQDQDAELPASIDVTGMVRDFREKTDPDGHPDFENRPDHGFARYSGNIGLAIGPDRKPVFVGGGSKVASQWRDSQQRQICYALFDASLGDVEGSWAQADSGGITSAETFAQWYHDLPGVNLSQMLTLTLHLQEDGQYVFDDRLDPMCADLGGFFPIEDQLFGNPGGSPDRNFHFTFELHMEFTYAADGDQFFKFIGDDDVWVFINDSLVIDLGGVHAAHDQFVDLDRLGLTDGETYLIDFFFAERHRTQSNFRIETNLPLQTAGLPTVNMAYD